MYIRQKFDDLQKTITSNAAQDCANLPLYSHFTVSELLPALHTSLTHRL